jgi:hypothetical protein
MTNSNLKVALLTQSLDQGGSERQVLNLAVYLSKNKYQTDIISINNKNEYKEEYKRELKKIRIFTLSPSLPSTFLSVKILESLFLLIQLIKGSPYRVFLAFDIHTYYYLLRFFLGRKLLFVFKITSQKNLMNIHLLLGVCINGYLNRLLMSQIR